MTPPSTPSRTPWARYSPHPPRLIALFGKIFLALHREDSRRTRHQYLRLQYGIGFPMDIGVYTVGPWSKVFGMPSGLYEAWLLQLDPARDSSRTAPSTAAVPSSPATAVARISVELAHQNYNDLLPSQIRRRAWHYPDRPSVTPATSASTIAATSYAARRPRHRANRETTAALDI